MSIIRKFSSTLAVLSFCLIALSSTAVTAADPVDGAGSTWSQIAVDQWRADVARQGLVVNYQGVGSTAGRVAYYQAQVDFAVSEIPFQTAQYDRQGNLLADETQLAASRPYAYLPIVAGGTAFMYNLKANGQRITDLRLSPSTAAKIFTGQLSMWNDPLIAADNPQRVLPATRIKPVVRSDGSGTTAQFTAFMLSETPNDWNQLCQKVNLGSSCPATSLYPDFPNSGFAAQQFSDGVANFVAAQYNDGAITYVEYGYAKERGFPVASLKNASENFAQPSAVNVSVALQGARVNSDGTQILSGVYQNTDARAYPLSSYSYMIVPTTEVAPFTAAKGASLSEYAYYFLCAGQQKAEQLGYAPLPKNLVEFAFESLARVPGALPAPAIGNCSNPTITGGFLIAKESTTQNTTAPTTNPADVGTGTPGAGTPGAGTPGNSATTIPGASVNTDQEATSEGVSEVTEEATEIVIAPITMPGVAMATSIEIETKGSDTSFLWYVLLVFAVLGIAVGPTLFAGRLRPSIKQ